MRALLFCLSALAIVATTLASGGTGPAVAQTPASTARPQTAAPSATETPAPSASVQTPERSAASPTPAAIDGAERRDGVLEASAAVNGPRGRAGRGTLVWLTTFNNGFTYTPVLANARGDRRRAVPFRAVQQPVLSARGDLLAYTGPVGDGSTGRYALYVSPTAKVRTRQRVTSPRFVDFDPDWTPNSRTLTFSRNLTGSYRSSNCCQLAIRTLGRPGVRLIARTRGGKHPSWAPDGRHLAYTDNRGLWTITRGGRERRLLTTGWVSDPDWSPDGQRIVYVRRTRYANSRLEVIGSRGGRARVLSARRGQVEQPTWRENNRGVVFGAYAGYGYEGRTRSSVWLAYGVGAIEDRIEGTRRPMLEPFYAEALSWRDVPVAGDWDGDGTDTVGVVRRDGDRLRWFLSDRNHRPRVWRTFIFGSAARGDQPVTGDWDGDGRDSIGVLKTGARRMRWLLADRTVRPRIDRSFAYGRRSMWPRPVTGDWDGDGADGVGLVRPLRNGDMEWRLITLKPRRRLLQRVLFGRARDGALPVTGDWNGDGRDRIGLVRTRRGGLVWRVLFNRLRRPRTVVEQSFGEIRRDDVTVTGDWDGRAGDGPGVVAPSDGTLQWRLADEITSPRLEQRLDFGAS